MLILLMLVAAGPAHADEPPRPPIHCTLAQCTARAMERSPFFTKVELVNSEMRTGETGGVTFDIGGVLE